MSALLTALQHAVGPSNVFSAAPVARYTTWRVGGAAALLCVAHDVPALQRVVEIAEASGRPWLVLGRGSNVLIDDRGFDGVVIVNRATALTIDNGVVRAESGVALSVLARRTVEAGLEGLEWCHDIPGSVGGAVVNNAGAHGRSLAEVVQTVLLWSVGERVREVGAAELAFDYRRSVLRAEEGRPVSPRPLVLTASFALQRADTAQVRARLEVQRARRKATQPGGASAGSVFKNPPGDSAGRLVESSGLKGYRCGAAAISALHANFIVTDGPATAAEILQLVALARRRVREQHGIDLESEIQFVRHDGTIGPPLPLCAEAL